MLDYNTYYLIIISLCLLYLVTSMITPLTRENPEDRQEEQPEDPGDLLGIKEIPSGFYGGA